MFSMTKVEPDVNMYLFFQKSMRGGVSYIPERYSKAFYDPKPETKHVIYLDTSKLHGNGMSKLLPNR